MTNEYTLTIARINDSIKRIPDRAGVMPMRPPLDNLRQKVVGGGGSA